MMRWLKYIPVLSALLAVAAFARGTYQEPDDFLREVFAGAPPEPQFVWLREELRETANTILGHHYPGLRIRYWREGKRSAWILEEIGKEKPITVGLVVNDTGLETIRVLVFRESRGWEVRHPFFTDQFAGASLSDNYQLDRNIDGISGATLSVRALKKLARLALYLHSQSAAANDAP
ncbi:MAG: FMN-binding protein [Gammaproteobacteria bacterium]